MNYSPFNEIHDWNLLLKGRSPIFVHANSSLAGLATIRASGNKEKFYREFETHYDSHSKAYFSFICIQRWFSIRLDFIVLIYIIFAIFSSIVAKGIKNQSLYYIVFKMNLKLFDHIFL